MAIVGGLDLHRGQITYDYVDTAMGEVHAGRIAPANRDTFREFLAELDTPYAEFVVEGCTGWWFVCDELAAAGMGFHVGDPAEVANLRGRKKRAKTDRADARLLRQLLVEDRVPESWIPPLHVLETRALGRLYLDLIAARNAWAQRIHATAFHHGAPVLPGDLTTADHQDVVVEVAESLPVVNRHAIETALRLINEMSNELDPVRRQLKWVGRHQPGARAIQAIYGIGELTGAIIWAELGDCRRFSSSRRAVRHTGLDITVHDSDGKRSAGRLARQGPGALRWALYESAQTASHRAAPDHAYYRDKKATKGHKIAVLSVARKIVRRCHHILVDLDDTALEPPTSRLPRPDLSTVA